MRFITRRNMKVILISMPDIMPLLPVLTYEALIRMPNLGIASVGGNIDAEHDVHIIDLVCKRRSIKRYLTKVLLKTRPDIVGLSAMAWQYDTCIKIARLVKSLLPEARIMIGGYHATLMYEEIGGSEDAKWIDFIIRGEGEEACRRLVNGLSGQDDLAEIPSLSYKKNGMFAHNPRTGALDLGTLKLPIRDRRRLTRGYRLLRYKIEVIETSRGCTRSCNFCSMRHMYGRSFRVFPIARVLEDIDDVYFKKKHGGYLSATIILCWINPGLWSCVTPLSPENTMD